MRTLRNHLDAAFAMPVLWTLAWTALASAACLTTFAISAIPAPMPDGRDIPLWLECCEALLAITMIPACAVIPVPLLIHVRRLFRRARIGRSGRWAAAWTISASAAVAVEALFLWRLTRNLTTPYANLPAPSWHALLFGIGYLAAGTAMTFVVAGAGRAVATQAKPA
jgi:hypothetical protein